MPCQSESTDYKLKHVVFPHRDGPPVKGVGPLVRPAPPPARRGGRPVVLQRGEALELDVVQLLVAVQATYLVNFALSGKEGRDPAT